MSQIPDLAGTIGTIVVTFLIVLGVIWHIQGDPHESIEKELTRQRRRDVPAREWFAEGFERIVCRNGGPAA